jgi:hypothetical protein
MGRVGFYTFLAMIPRFYRSQAGFDQIHLRLKQHHCPHCRVTGTLILHGYLRGYDLKKINKKIIRGRRVFCSNRNRRRGCGRTWSVMLATMLKGFIVQTSHLWGFLKNIAKGMNVFQAFSIRDIPLSPTSIYRLYKRLYENQPHIRSRLAGRLAPPRDVRHANPLVKTILHMGSAFKRNSDPPATFQYIFQRSFL